VVAFAVLLAAGTASAQPAYKVSNASPIDWGWGAEMVEFNGQLYYSALGALMRSDGTPAGTTVVKSGISPQLLTVMDVGGSPHLLFAASQPAAATSSGSAWHRRRHVHGEGHQSRRLRLD
jgi:hypothetical protein